VADDAAASEQVDQITRITSGLHVQGSRSEASADLFIVHLHLLCFAVVASSGFLGMYSDRN